MASVEWEGTRPARLYGVIKDITDRVAQRQAAVPQGQRMRLATESGGIGIWEMDLATRKTVWDAQMFRLFGRDPEIGAAAAWREAMHPEDGPPALSALEDALSMSRRFEADFRISWPNGNMRHLHSVADVIISPQTERPTLLGVTWDVIPLRHLAAELATQSERLRVTLRSISDGVVTTDAAGRVTWLNPVAEELTGWTEAEAYGLPIAEVLPLHDEVNGGPAPDPDLVARTEVQAIALTGDAVLTSRRGIRHGIEISAAPIRDDYGAVQGTILVLRDVTTARQERASLAWRASHDALTGLLNRSESELLLDGTLARTKERAGVHSLLCIDLDRFKRINDSFGHAAGDRVLCEVAALMGSAIRSTDVLARLGGDEFGVILEHCPPERAKLVAQDICDALTAYRFLADGHSLALGASIGLARIDSQSVSAAEVLKLADAASFAAKANGGNRVLEACYSDVETHRSVSGRGWGEF